MNAEMIARTIQLILAPVLMISASAILQSGVLGHYTSISDRIRSLNQERLVLLRDRQEHEVIDTNIKELEQPVANVLMAMGINKVWLFRERLQEIDRQIPHLIDRHKLTRDAVLAVYSSILLFVIDMCVIGLAVIAGSITIANLALVVFLIGTVAFLIGVFAIAKEIGTSHWAIRYEASRILELQSRADD